MPLEKIPDESGHTMTLIPYKGRYGSPQFNEKALNNMSDFPLREDDVILCSYSKSGCHWVWEIIRLLLAGKLPEADEVIHKEDHMMEWQPDSEYSSLPSPRVLNNHMTFEMQPKDLLRKKVKVVFIYRNVKDVIVSFYHHHTGIWEYEYNGDFSSHLRRMLNGLTDNGNPFEYVRGWERGIAENPDLPVFVSSYELLKKNNLSEVKRLSEFLGKTCSEEFLQEVCDVTSFSKMKQLKGDTSFKNKQGQPVMYRKGQVGDWKNYFTVAENEWLDDVIKRETAGSKFTYEFTV